MSYIPKQGDIIKMSFNPTLGHEQQGNHRPASVVSNNSYNIFAKGTAIVCPITNTDRALLTHIRLDGRTKTTGIIMCEQAKALDLTKRKAVFEEKAPQDILEACDIISGFIEIED